MISVIKRHYFGPWSHWGITAFFPDTWDKSASMLKNSVINKDNYPCGTYFQCDHGACYDVEHIRWMTYIIYEDLVRKLKLFETDKVVSLYVKADTHKAFFPPQFHSRIRGSGRPCNQL